MWKTNPTREKQTYGRKYKVLIKYIISLLVKMKFQQVKKPEKYPLKI